MVIYPGTKASLAGRYYQFAGCIRLSSMDIRVTQAGRQPSWEPIHAPSLWLSSLQNTGKVVAEMKGVHDDEMMLYFPFESTKRGFEITEALVSTHTTELKMFPVVNHMKAVDHTIMVTDTRGQVHAARGTYQVIEVFNEPRFLITPGGEVIVQASLSTATKTRIENYTLEVFLEHLKECNTTSWVEDGRVLVPKRRANSQMINNVVQALRSELLSTKTGLTI